MIATAPDALDQDLDLYRNHRDTIDAACAAEPLNNMRHAAFAALESIPMRLPGKGDEGYAVTDLNGMFTPDYGININRLPGIGRCGRGVPLRRTTPLNRPRHNSQRHPRLTDTTARALPEGVWFGSLRRFAQDHPTRLEQFYGAIVPMKRPEVALNTLLAQDGILLG